MSEKVDLTASWSCLLLSSVLVIVCIYSSVPATSTILKMNLVFPPLPPLHNILHSVIQFFIDVCVRIS